MTTPAPELPHSREAEEALIGSVLINSLVFSAVALSAEAFYIHRHRFIWEAYARLDKRGAGIDILTVSEELDDMGRLDDIGGPAYLTAMLNQVPTTLHATEYAEVVRGDHARRLLLQAANKIATLAFDSRDLNAADVMTGAEKTLHEVAKQVDMPDVLVDFVDGVGELYDDIMQRRQLAAEGKPVTSQRISSGLADVDKVLKGGLPKGTLNIIAGRPGQGKSAWMQTLVLDAIKNGKKVAMFSLEMSRRELIGRMMASRTGIEAASLTEKALEDDQVDVFIASLDDIQRDQLFLSDAAAITPAKLRALASQMQARYGLDLLVVDYLQLMQAGSGNNFREREQEVAYCSRSLKLLAMELGIPVLAAAQLNRASEVRADKEPELSDLRESGAIENDADMVAFIWRPDTKDNVSRFKIGKHRGGPTGIVDLFFDTRLTRFADLAKKNETMPF